MRWLKLSILLSTDSILQIIWKSFYITFQTALIRIWISNNYQPNIFHKMQHSPPICHTLCVLGYRVNFEAAAESPKAASCLPTIQQLRLSLVRVCGLYWLSDGATMGDKWGKNGSTWDHDPLHVPVIRCWLLWWEISCTGTDGCYNYFLVMMSS